MSSSPINASTVLNAAGLSKAMDEARPAANPADAGGESGAVSDRDRQRVRQAAEKFESMFIGQMLQQMRRTTNVLAAEDSPGKNKINEDMLAMADTAVADALSHQHAFGIADAILKQLLPATPAAQAGAQAAATSVNSATAAFNAAPRPVASPK